MTRADDAYLEGFMSGLEFVLLAMEGRNLGGDALETFRRDYGRIVEAYRKGSGTAVPTGALLALLRN